MCQSLDNIRYSSMTFCDISEAFDGAWLKDLLFKLKHNGIDSIHLESLLNYLSNRSQKVVLQSATSTPKQITADVP